jgi:hypothetical protein
MKYSAVQKILCLLVFVHVKIAYCFCHMYCLHPNWHWFPAHFAADVSA